MSSATGSGRSATALSLEAELGTGQSLALAGWAELLPVAGRTGHPVVETDTLQRQLQVVDVHARGEALAATGAGRALTLLPHPLVELDAELGRPLEDVEELPER